MAASEPSDSSWRRGLRREAIRSGEEVRRVGPADRLRDNRLNRSSSRRFADVGISLVQRWNRAAVIVAVAGQSIAGEQRSERGVGKSTGIRPGPHLDAVCPGAPEVNQLTMLGTPAVHFDDIVQPLGEFETGPCKRQNADERARREPSPWSSSPIGRWANEMHRQIEQIGAPPGAVKPVAAPASLPATHQTPESVANTERRIHVASNRAR